MNFRSSDLNPSPTQVDLFNIGFRGLGFRVLGFRVYMVGISEPQKLKRIPSELLRSPIGQQPQTLKP